MFQTEFCGPDHKLLISWDTGNCQNYSFEDDILNDNDIFHKLNELYRSISKFSTEFVECVKTVHGPSNLEQLQNHLHENNPNVTVKIENLNNKESYSDELFLLRQQVEKLKEENERLVSEHEKEIAKLQNDCEVQTNKLIEEQEQKLNSLKQELENKYNLEMSDLRRYFENKCTESLRQFTEESYQCSRDSDSDSYSDIEQDDENYETITSTKYGESNIDHATKNLQKILDKDLKNIRKAYILEVDKLKEHLTKQKDEEIREFKRALESKYMAKFETLQSQLDCLLNDKNLDNTANSIHSQVKEDYQAELENLQTISDLEFASKIQNEFILREQELDKRDQEWKNNIESSISDIVVEHAIKTVLKETHQKSQSCHCSPSKKYKYKEVKQLKQKYKQEMQDLRHQYENEIESTVYKFEHQIRQLTEENDQLINQNKDLLQLNEKYTKEIESLKQKTIENLQRLKSTQEREIVERIKEEVSKMKECYDTDMSNMRDSKYALEKAFDELQSELFNMQNTRKNVISSLQTEFKELIEKEKNGQQVSWPEELQVFRQFCVFQNTNKSDGEVEQIEVSVYNKNSLDMSNGDVYEDDLSGLEEILKQRNTLRKVILTLYSACEGFRRYITNLDEDRNATLNNELAKIGLMPCKVSADMTLDDVIRSLDETEKENLRKINLASNMSEVMNLFGGEEDVGNLTLECNKTFNHSELSIWFEKLKNDAAAILCLTSGKKVEVDTNIDAETQTDMNGQHYDRIQEIMEDLQNEYAKAQSDINDLGNEVERLNEKVSAYESLEAYGENISGVAMFSDNSNKAKEQTTFSRVEEFCSECDKVREEAKKDKEDLQSQVEAASKKLKGFEQFLERETAEREAEREEFDKQLEILQSLLKEKERELCSLNNHAIELNTMELQLKELTNDYETTKIRNQSLETELTAASNKICTLRERNQELEMKLAQKSELAEEASVKLKEKEQELLILQQEYQSIRHELDSLQDNGCKQLDLLHEQHEISSALINQMKAQLLEVEKSVLTRTREVENNYATVSSSTVVSSPSEDISVCDRIADRVRLISPSGSDVSSSPIHLPVDLLSCLNEKLKKLFRAEEAAFKRIQDQDIQINKMSIVIDELHLEKDTIQEKLNETAAKLAEARIDLDNWQYRANATQSEAVSKLKKTIASLQTQIDDYEKLVTQKEAKLKEYSTKIKHLENYIKSSECDFNEKIRKMEEANDDLKRDLRESTNEINKLNDLLSGHRREENLSLSTVVEKLLDEKNQQIHQLEDKLDVLKSLAEMGERGHSTEIDSKTSSKVKGNLTETLESYADLSSDHTRHAVVSDLSISPRYISISSSVKKPLLGSGTNESTCSLQPIEEVDEVFRSETAFQPAPADRKEVTFKDDSIVVNLDDMSWNRADRTIASNSVQDQLAVFKNQFEEEKRNHFATLIQLRELNSRWEAEKKQMKEAEAASAQYKENTEKRLRDLEWEHASCKEQCYKYEQQVLLVTKDLQNAKQTIDSLNKQLEQMDALKNKLNEIEYQYKHQQDQCASKDQRVIELTTILEAEKSKTRELNENYEKWLKAVVKERVEAQVKCEEYAHKLNSLSKELETEKDKCDKLTLIVESFDHRDNDRNEELNNRIKEQAQEITDLRNTLAQLQTDIEEARYQLRQMEQENEQLKKSEQQKVVQSSDVSSYNSTLKDLAQKVQKEVDLAALLDENMLQSLQFDSKSESFQDALTKLSPLSEELRQILVKILQHGFEVLDAQEKNILRNTYDVFDSTHSNQIETLKNSTLSLSELVEQLQSVVETERKNNKELKNKNYKLQFEIESMDKVHRYFEERITFLSNQVEEHRAQAMKAEIALTCEQTTRRQIEFAFERYKKQVAEKQNYDGKKLEETVNQLKAISSENLKLKRETDVLRNKVDSLIAELNSVKAITQYHSDSETELSRISPLKERVNELEERLAKMKHEYEKKKMEVRNLKSTLSMEVNSVKKLESALKEVSSEKHKIEKQLIDTKGSLDELKWQKQKLEDKLKAAQIADLKRRKMQSVKEDVFKKEYEGSQEFQRKLERDCEEFKHNVTKLANELVTCKSSCKQITQEAQRIFLRMLRAESSQRSLVYQKNYLVVTLHEYENKCNSIVRSITSGAKSFSNYVAEGISLKQRFKSFVICIISIHRMQILINRRTNNNFAKMKHYFVTHIPEIAARTEEYFDSASMKKLHPDESKKPLDTENADDLLLQNLCQQYARLKQIYVTETPTDQAS